MSEDYLAYWGMQKPPFSLTPDPEMLYLSTQHSECLMRLKYAIFSHKGGALLVSDTAGNGKTSLLARLQNDLRDYYAGRVRVAFIDHPTLTPIEMLGEIARQLGGELHTSEKIRSLNYLRDKLFSFYNDNIKVVVIVDEGQMLKDRPDILGELRILLNFCVSDAFLLTFVFSGQKPLDSILREMPEFWQRLPVRFVLKNLSFDDTRSLIQYRLRKVGASEEIFTSDAYEGIYNYSEGCPRVICSIADLCLLVGYAKRSRRIGFVEVSSACRDMESSGDSFHYFAYIKNRDDGPSRQSEPERKVQHRQTSVSKKKRPETRIVPGETGRPVPCLNCSEDNPAGALFCSGCGAALARKCPSCGTLVDTVSKTCGSCGTDMDRARISRIERLREDLRPFDILERNYDVWLTASGMKLEETEQVIIIFPRGNFFTPGPLLQVPGARGKQHMESCDVILTERRFILDPSNGTISLPLERIETCMVSESGNSRRGAHELIIGMKDGIHTVRFPSGSTQRKAMLDSIVEFARSVALK